MARVRPRLENRTPLESTLQQGKVQPL